MANVSIKFNNKEFLLACEDGQGEHVEELLIQINKQAPFVTLIAALICYEPGKHRLIISPFAATVNQSLKLG